MNIVFDFGNVLVRWEPKEVFLPYFDNDEERYDYFWANICDSDFRNRIDAGEKQSEVIQEYQSRYPEYANLIAMYWTHWEQSLPGEMPGMFSLVKKLKETPGNHIYGLTNWSMETYPIARNRFPILQLIDDYVVSGAEHLVKPDHRLFQILLDRFCLKAEECIFIDDNAANVASACQMGFRGIVFQGAENLRLILEQLPRNEL